MCKSNVIVLGPSGVGKSTLISAICGEEEKSFFGTIRPYEQTEELETHECEEYGIRFVDTVGFDPSAAKQKQAVKLVQKWTEEGAKKKNEKRAIDLVWFCVDGSSRRVFPRDIDNFIHAVKIWKDVPVIVVATKAYEEPIRQDLIEEAQEVFSAYSTKINLKGIIPVVAAPLVVASDMILQSYGLQELMDKTLEVLPEGKKKREKVQLRQSLTRRRSRARVATLASVMAAVGIGLTKINFSAAILLEPIEKKMIDEIAKQYEIVESSQVEVLKNKLITSGTVGGIATKAVQLLKKVPPVQVKGIKIDIARVANAVVAGSIVAGVGESTRFVFERLYMKDETTDSLEWVDRFLNEEMSVQVTENIKTVFEKTNKMKKPTPTKILTAIKESFVDNDSEKH